MKKTPLIVATVLAASLTCACAGFALADKTADASATDTVEQGAALPKEQGSSEESAAALTTADVVKDAFSGTSGEKLLGKVLDALDNDTYRTTLEALRSGEAVTADSEGETVEGVQQVLADLGWPIEVDGVASEDMFDMLNTVFSACGMKPVEVVDADAYVQLLTVLFIYKDGNAATTLLHDAFAVSKEANAYDYIQGGIYALLQRHYSAKVAFEKSHFADYKERAAACVQPWPEDGELFHNEDLYSDEMNLTFTVNNGDDSQGTFFEVYTEDGYLASTLFITGSGSVSTWLPGGNYRIRDAAGYEWYGTVETFGPDGFYETMKFWEFEDDDYLTALDAGYGWEISINASSGSGGQDVGAETADWGSWTA